MRITTFSLWLLLIFALIPGCDDDPTGPAPDSITGRVLGLGFPASGATVFLVPLNMWFMPWIGPPTSTQASPLGWFSFSEVPDGQYVLYAGQYGAGSPSVFSCVSPLSERITIPDENKTDHHEVVLRLQEVVVGSSVSGAAVIAGTHEPAEGARMTLFRFEGMTFEPVDSTFAGVDGSYLFTDACTGNHVTQALLEGDGGPFPSPLMAESGIFFCDGVSASVVDTLYLTDIAVDKPAIYIYPEEAGRFQVHLGLNAGTRLTDSEPEYGDGWEVFVSQSGRIDDRYDYLFYEASLAQAPVLAAGWCVDGMDLEGELAPLLTALGLNAVESTDFLDYWLTRLPERPYYLVYPVMGRDLDTWVELDVSPAPTALLRFWFFFAGSDVWVDLPEPQVAFFQRSGTTVVEWGGAVLQ